MTTGKKTETTTPVSTREAAEAIGTTPKELRVFLRASDDYKACGAGSRYVFTAADLGPMGARFVAWTRARAAKKDTATTPDPAPAAVTMDDTVIDRVNGVPATKPAVKAAPVATKPAGRRTTTKAAPKA